MSASSKPPSVKDFRVSPPGSLRSLLLEGSTPVLLLGAGASVTSGIPGAGIFAEKAVRWAWCREFGRSPEDSRVQRSDYWPWVCSQSWFSDTAPLVDQYPKVIEKLLGVKKVRRDFFEHMISPGIPPNQGYRALARILNEGWISTVLTTNFDHCLEDAKVIENKPHYLVSIKTSADLVRFNASPSQPQLIYLHGSVEHYSDQNLDYEVTSIKEELVNRLAPVLRDHPLVVVGYRGAEQSIMEGLLRNSCDVTNNFAQGVYWCVRKADGAQTLPPLLAQFAKQIGTNFQIVEIDGFDELFHRDLWDRLRAENAIPLRRAHGYAPVETTFDMREVGAGELKDLDRNTLSSRLTQYAKRLGLWAPSPDDPADDWLKHEASARNLVREKSGAWKTTVAGWILFAPKPQDLLGHAKVVFTAKGPAAWIRKCFGPDATQEGIPPGETVSVEQEIVGNLWAQLTLLTDQITLVNAGFRLKEEVSRTVYPYDGIALKEIIVNALVHRDYERSDPVKVDVFPERIEVSSPGGIVAEVASQVNANSLEEAVRSGTRGIKGYRNPVITDLFYGGGQMDRAGSGLADVWTLTRNNNGDVKFGPDAANNNFVVTLFSRPEAVDEITNTAIPVATETVRFATNILPVEEMPQVVWHVGCTARTRWELKKQAMGLAVPPGFVQDGRLFTLYNLDALVSDLVTPFEEGDVEHLSVHELLNMPNGETILLKLMNDSMFEHIKALGMQSDRRRRRAFFPNIERGERKFTYRGRVKRATRTVVKARKRRGTEVVSYYEHKAFSFSIMRFDVEWGVLVTPGYAFTKDGIGKFIGKDKINSLSTKRAARDFNPTVHHDVTFWAAVLSDGASGRFSLKLDEENDLGKYAPSISLSSLVPTIAVNTAGVFDEDAADEETAPDLDELDEELTVLAESDDDTSEEGDDDE